MKQLLLFCFICGVSIVSGGSVLVMPCDQPKFNKGPCDGKFRRWSYDFPTNQCLNFTYKGCMGNRNNFLTKKDCTDNCVKHAKFYSKLRLPPAYLKPY